MTTKTENHYIARAYEIARAARSHGNHPFGALLVSPDGQILLEAENTVLTEQDATGHAETNLMRAASQRFSADFLETCTLYTSTEPCAMCCGAIFWGNVRRVVFGLSGKSLIELVGENTEEALDLPSKEVFRCGRKKIEVVGPMMETEGLEVHAGFWEIE